MSMLIGTCGTSFIGTPNPPLFGGPELGLGAFGKFGSVPQVSSTSVMIGLVPVVP